MEKPDYIIAAAQMAPLKADMDQNIRKHLELIDLAAWSAGGDLIGVLDAEREGMLIIHKGGEPRYKKAYL